ncbi:LysR substrate-binding domain-containing protein [Pseudomonas asplenii]|uniref:Transcriptional regulator, LysR family n=1 Tax=Pseudomonas asplenii TaxID=53407 RepID=A0A0M9GHR9_9PSED|nr:LysR substrate-binding domain-containing protein [Pseudomonas fuscovaginae]KPA91220.1 transcriptional regulator, LysR family [Pseudomonas fuscovaginae]KPA94607.1 transcriptional regulator, LysR family [Pseudomonas fuscovaginae]
MSLREFRTLVAIAQYGSFARAAEAIHLTQSAVSLHVKSLEDTFGAPLFDRTRRIPLMTPAGHLVLDRAREILAIHDSIAADLSDGSQLRGTLRIGAIHTALSGFLPAALAALSAEHPHLRVNVASGMSAELAIRIDNGELDAAITTEPVKPYPFGLVSTPLYQEGFWIVAPANLPCRDPRGLLQDYPFIRFDRRAWAGRTIERELRRLRIRVQTSMELDSQDAILQMVASGLGVSIIPLSRQNLPASRKMLCLPFGEPQQMRTVVLLEREDRPAGRSAQALVQAVRTQAGHATTHEKLSS